MSVFQHYARYYDLLYQDKNYPAEIAYIVDKINRHQPAAKTILDLGCGTGRHACLLAEKGYDVVGVDFSESMIALAKDRKNQQKSNSQYPVFQQGDIRRLDLNKQFDVVISLFHVFSYLTANEDLAQGFQTVSRHLKPGGLFLFDFWYGPAVLAQQPEIRTKHLADEVIEVQRLARPEIHINDNIVDVNYDLSIREHSTGKIDKIREQHRMRYLFLPEVRQYLQNAGLQYLFAEEWLTRSLPSPQTWGVCCGAAHSR